MLTEFFPINSNQFMDNNPPRALYPYAQRAHAAITTVFRDNLAMFKCLGAAGVNEDGEYVDCFGELIDEPVLEELMYKDEIFMQTITGPEDDSDKEMEDGPDKEMENVLDDMEMEDVHDSKETESGPSSSKN